ncbi:MAG: hypothetical protein NTU41_08060 [Chloroflexi bacterium]|nr:hypothetical protein [Chloroflexota bacterium]
MANQAEKPKKTVSEGAFRHYVFSVPELSGEAQRFLRQAGYETKPTAYVGLVQPDFRARRKTDGAIYEILGLVRDKFDQAVEALTRLAAMRTVKPDADCVLVLPPINEYLLIEFLMEEEGRWYFGMKDARLTMWFCNPEDKTTMCVIGGPRDRDIEKHFFLGGVSFDSYMATRGAHLMQARLLAEEEEE